MEQKDYYFLYVYAGVEAEQIGPFGTEQERDNALEEHKEKEGEGKITTRIFPSM